MVQRDAEKHLSFPLQRKQAFLERFYENKKRFLLLLPDGTGSCLYPFIKPDCFQLNNESVQ